MLENRLVALTVGIPAYKEAFLDQAVESVLAQGFGDFELLISDDSLDDRVRIVLDRFKDPRIRRIEGPHRGLVANSVHLWEQARADLLKFVYDDDYLLPGALERLHGILNAHPQVPFAFSWRQIVDDSGQILYEPRSFEGDRPRLIAGNAVARGIVGTLVNPIGEPSNLLIRRSLFADARCLSHFCGIPIRHMIDVAFFLNAARIGQCVGVPAFLSAFRRHPTQVTSQNNSPAFSAGLYEWELFIRGAVQDGLVAPADTLPALARLEGAYRSFGGLFPELVQLLGGLADLKARLSVGGCDVLTPTFLADLAAAGAQIDARLRSQAGRAAA